MDPEGDTEGGTDRRGCLTLLVSPLALAAKRSVARVTEPQQVMTKTPRGAWRLTYSSRALDTWKKEAIREQALVCRGYDLSYSFFLGTLAKTD